MRLRFAVFAISSPILMAALSFAARPEPVMQSGKSVYDRVCSGCHGEEGRGDAGPGPALVPLEREYPEVLAIVRGGSSEMPAIPPERVSDDAVKQIVEYLKSLKAAPANPAPGLR